MSEGKFYVRVGDKNVELKGYAMYVYIYVRFGPEDAMRAITDNCTIEEAAEIINRAKTEIADNDMGEPNEES